MIYIISHFWYALLTLVILTLVLHLCLVYPKNLSKKQWKQADYFWVGLTALGLIGSTNAVSNVLDQSALELASNRMQFTYRYMRSFLDSAGASAVCWQPERSEYSPDNFDSIAADFDEACAWSKIVYQTIVATDTAQGEPIDTSRIPILETRHNRWFRDLVLDNISHYNNHVAERKRLEAKLDSHTDVVTLFFSPLLLIVGLAIRITKVTGELRHEKAAEKVAATG